uniref:lysozyme n=1 Tax=Pseudonaja textilis TaxID=8673 RepID=A0A670YTV0_PSETE
MKGLCLWLAVLTCLVVKVYGKIFNRCELASVMRRWGMEGHEGYTLDDWVCLAYFASGFNTGKVTQNIDGSTEYGIFQINSRSWCADQHSTSRNLCSLSCRGKCSFENIHVKVQFIKIEYWVWVWVSFNFSFWLSKLFIKENIGRSRLNCGVLGAL